MHNEQQYSVKKYARPYFLAVVIAVIFGIFASVASILGPDKLSEITDIIVAGIGGDIDLAKIRSIGLFLLTIYAGGAILNYGQGYIMATISQIFSRKLREDISNKINRVPLNYFDSHKQGDTLSRVTNDVDTLSQSLSQSLGILITSVTLFLGSLFMMFKTNVIMSIASILAVAVGFVMMVFIMKLSQGYFTQQQQKLAVINGQIEETYSGHNLIYSYNGVPKAKDTFAEMNSDLYTSVWKAQFLSGIMQPVMMFIGNFGYVIVCVVGAILALEGKITFGVIVAFTAYVRMFSQPLGQIAQAATSLQSASAAAKRVMEFLNEDEMENEEAKTETLTDIQGNVKFENVSFGYNADKLVIKNFTAEAKAGKKVAIVGPTGAGKTTMVNLLMKFYEINSGDIFIDGKNTKDLSRETIHEQFCMVLQETWLFEGTIKENLIYNQENVTDEQVKAACKAVGVHRYIKTLPKGYDTVLDDKVDLSVGQRQLMTIARALIKNAPMLILDEATSSVDTRTEILIQEAMDKLMEGRTSFVIAHRLSTIRNADLILVMKEGNIIESGNHDDLMAQNGFYADLYNSQFEE